MEETSVELESWLRIARDDLFLDVGAPLRLQWPEPGLRVGLTLGVGLVAVGRTGTTGLTTGLAGTEPAGGGTTGLGLVCVDGR